MIKYRITNKNCTAFHPKENIGIGDKISFILNGRIVYQVFNLAWQDFLSTKHSYHIRKWLAEFYAPKPCLISATGEVHKIKTDYLIGYFFPLPFIKIRFDSIEWKPAEKLEVLK